MNNNKKEIKLQVIQITQGEIQDAMKHFIWKNKKKYNRKTKHKENDDKIS